MTETALAPGGGNPLDLAITGWLHAKGGAVQ
jgi:hypothetical protein